ncbi:5742_t:CDS:2 [Paraglomus occultum]|uniref:3-hydroxyisobutyryl-CoA hydrolase n=1 Tax=Paraglomus occultum TaxID=144539 RepID=A0A9N8ZNE5_9GLOM|nr:5742_t:CDS:2 [Paraglomus occultum]
MSLVTSNAKTELARVFPGTPEVDVIHRRILGSRMFILNKPDKLNALDLSMVRNMTPQLQAWNESDLCKVIIIKGAGDKAFCAGGDVTSVVRLAEQEKTETTEEGNALRFFEEEYQLNHLIATLDKPYVALLNGITMGGGFGLSVHGSFRVATENTVFAMPETAIGLFPDVGGSFYLPRMDGEVGTYLALTGNRLFGLDVFFSGIATHYVPSERLPHLEDRLSELESDDHEVINAAIEDFVEKPEPNYRYALGGQIRESIDRCFKYNSVSEIVEALEKEDSGWALETKEVLSRMSPTSLKVTLRELRLGKRMTITDCLQMEYGLVNKFLEKSDFKEGVRARLIDKTDAPRWDPPSLSKVIDKDIEDFYFKSTNDKILNFLNLKSFENYPYARFGLPTEDDIRKLVTGELPDAGAIGMTEEEIVDFFLKENRGKIGTREKVSEVLRRKTVEIGSRALKWVD